MKIHFDGFTSKWDESYGEQEWREKKLAPLYTKVANVPEVCVEYDGVTRS